MAIASASETFLLLYDFIGFLLISLLQGVFCCRCFACCFVYRFHHKNIPDSS